MHGEIGYHKTPYAQRAWLRYHLLYNMRKVRFKRNSRSAFMFGYMYNRSCFCRIIYLSCPLTDGIGQTRGLSLHAVVPPEWALGRNCRHIAKLCGCFSPSNLRIICTLHRLEKIMRKPYAACIDVLN